MEALDMAQAAAVPNGVTAIAYDREYTSDGVLSSIRPVVIYEKDGVELGRRKVRLSDGPITRAMATVYEEARTPVYNASYDAASEAVLAVPLADGQTEEQRAADADAAGRSAGHQAVAAAGIVAGDPQAAWAVATSKVAADESAVSIVKLLVSKDWGRLLLREAW